MWKLLLEIMLGLIWFLKKLKIFVEGMEGWRLHLFFDDRFLQKIVNSVFATKAKITFGSIPEANRFWFFNYKKWSVLLKTKMT